MKQISLQEADVLEKQGKGLLVRRTKNRAYLLVDIDETPVNTVEKIAQSKKTKSKEEY